MPKTIACLMINAHPQTTRLPQGVKVVLVQGSDEEIWPRERGLGEMGLGDDKCKSGKMKAPQHAAPQHAALQHAALKYGC